MIELAILICSRLLPPCIHISLQKDVHQEYIWKESQLESRKSSFILLHSIKRNCKRAHPVHAYDIQFDTLFGFTARGHKRVVHRRWGVSIEGYQTSFRISIKPYTFLTFVSFPLFGKYPQCRAVNSGVPALTA